jgi:hypothetical protein
MEERMIREFDTDKNMLKRRCPVCEKKFQLKEKIILCPIQAPKGDYFINAMAIPIHLNCYFVDLK